jgi:hypothetical protein
LNIRRGSHLNVSKRVYEDTNAECLKATEYIGDFGHRRFNDSYCKLATFIRFQGSRQGSEVLPLTTF